MTKEFLYRIKDFRQKCNTNFNFLLISIVVLGGYVCIRSSYEFVIFSISIISLGITVGFVYINTVKNKMLVKKISNIKKIYFFIINNRCCYCVSYTNIVEKRQYGRSFLFIKFTSYS